MKTKKKVPVRERIIDAAADIFGRHGFKAATVREICREAGVNGAAVNYYFHGKEGLYREVVVRMMERTFTRFPLDMGLDPGASAEQRLAAFIRAILYRFLSHEGFSALQGKGHLIARELADPSPVLEGMIREFIRPTVNILRNILSELLGPNYSADQLWPFIFSVVGQCFYYAFARPIIYRLTRIDLEDPRTIDALARHILSFSLSGLKGSCRQGEKNDFRVEDIFHVKGEEE